MSSTSSTEAWAIGHIGVGVLGANRPEKEQGYFCCIAAMTADNQFQDLHITKEQAIELVRNLSRVLRLCGEEE